MRPVEELINAEDSALPLVAEWIATAATRCELLPPAQDRARVLTGLQVTTRSPMGAVAYETGGLLIDNGWLRILGSGHQKLTRNILDWNSGRSAGFLLVADDVVGGFFAINSGGLGSDPGGLYYWAPDTLEWESLEVGYSDFLQWATSERLQDFYSNLRWPDWLADVKCASADECFNFYPFLWTAEGSVVASSRKLIGVAEQYAFNTEMAVQLRESSN